MGSSAQIPPRAASCRPKRRARCRCWRGTNYSGLLVQAKAEGYYELFLLDLATGLRRGELLALQWGDLDFETGVLTISKQVSLVRGKIVMSVPKTKNSIRKLVLPPAVVRVLWEYRKSVHSRCDVPVPSKRGLSHHPRRGAP